MNKQPAACALAAPVAWPCEIEEADFERGVVRLKMRCADYKVGAGLHWLHTAPPRAIPPGYKLVPIQKLVDLKASIHGDCFRGTDWELETISTMLIAAAPEAPKPRKQPLTDEEIDNTTRKQVDDLLDHIYEYGTAAEGIDYRVRAIARAIEAAHGIGEHE